MPSTQHTLIFMLLIGLCLTAPPGFPAETRLSPESRPASESRLSSAADGLLKRNVGFWVRIYTEYYTHQGLIHDAKYIDKIYEVIDLRGLDRSKNRIIRETKKKWRLVLLSAHKKRMAPETMNLAERKVFDLYADVQDGDRLLNAAHHKRLRYQLGQKDRFMEGLHDSGRYLPEMEEVFRSNGLPVELTRLPFVESSFNTKARSKVGASGIWQFMRSTGKRFLKINDAVDERNDPIRATEAAAKLLKQNFDSLGNWPLAVTAYNHGRTGLMRAVRRVGSDELDDIVDGYRSRSFGFASSNFYAELMAAIECEKNAEKYYGKVDRGLPMPHFEVVIPDSLQLKELVRFQKLDLPALKALNPALSEAVFRGKRRLPGGYKLRVPLEHGLPQAAQIRIFMDGYERIPPSYKLYGKRGRK